MDSFMIGANEASGLFKDTLFDYFFPGTTEKDGVDRTGRTRCMKTRWDSVARRTSKCYVSGRPPVLLPCLFLHSLGEAPNSCRSHGAPRHSSASAVRAFVVHPACPGQPPRRRLVWGEKCREATSTVRPIVRSSTATPAASTCTCLFLETNSCFMTMAMPWMMCYNGSVRL